MLCDGEETHLPEQGRMVQLKNLITLSWDVKPSFEGISGWKLFP